MAEIRACLNLSAGNWSRADRAMPADIYNWFTEGFDTADLKEAKALLDELSDQRSLEGPTRSAASNSTFWGESEEPATMERREWHEVADWFDEDQGDTGDLWHRTIIFPGILKAIGDAAGIDVLDVGCGNGSLARILARRGSRVTGLDGSTPIIERARAREAANPLGITYQACDATRLTMIADNAFDLVVTCRALMDMPDAAGAIREMARVVRRGGRCVILISHPCFDVPGASSWLAERKLSHGKKVSRRVRRYRGTFDAWEQWSSDSTLELHRYHRSLSWYFGAIRTAGMAVTMLEELRPTAELLEQQPEGAAIDEFPMHLVIEARPCPTEWCARPR